MKKITFSLVVVTAFSFSSMANDISELREKITPEKNLLEKIEFPVQDKTLFDTGVNLDISKFCKKSILKIKPVLVNKVMTNAGLSDTPCYDIFIRTYYYLISMGFTISQSRSLALTVHANCILETYGPKTEIKME